MSRTVEYINDSSIAPEKRLEAYNSFFKSSGDGESIFSKLLKEDMEKLSLKNNLLNKEEHPIL